MNIPLRTVPLLLAGLFLYITTAIADIRVYQATYGSSRRTTDVTGRVQTFANRGKYSFQINNDNMGKDPDKGERKRFTIKYASNGRQFTDSVAENSTFRFNRGNDSRPNYPSKPSRPTQPPQYWTPYAPQSGWGDFSPLAFSNRLPFPIFLYQQDGWGRWNWIATLNPGVIFRTSGPVGSEWLLTDPRGGVVERHRARPGPNTIVAGGNFMGIDPW